MRMASLFAFATAVFIFARIETGHASSLQEIQAMFKKLSPSEQALFLRNAPIKTKTRNSKANQMGHINNPSNSSYEEVKAKSQPLSFSDSTGIKLPQDFSIFLRHDFADLGGSLSSIKPADKAQGAEISYSNNFYAGNYIWSSQALTGFSYVDYIGNDPPNTINLFKMSVGAYGAIDKVFNSSAKAASGNSDTLSGGGLLELGIDHFLGGTDYFRFRGGVTDDNLTPRNQTNATLEYLPVHGIFYDSKELAENLGYVIEPELLMQYDWGNNIFHPLLFNNQLRSLRIGPQISLILFQYERTDSFLARLNGRIVYHPAYETYSGKYIDYLMAALTYNLDAHGNFGITTSYQRGHQEDTGVYSNIFKISLSGKY